jgi:hypothetical protein
VGTAARRRTTSGRPTHERSRRIGAIAGGTLAAATAWLTTRWIAARFMWSPSVTGLVAFCAAWVALYPLARRNRHVPAWTHWARGGFVLVVLWLVTLFIQ